MTARTVGYWTCTALVAFAFVSGGVVYVMRAPHALEGLQQLGYPVHFMVLLGVWKLLGGIAILLPRLPLVKEWAYAGILFDLTGASAAHVAMASDLRHVVVPLVIAALAAASWALRPASRRLAGV
jgi:hypothetical protein